MYTPDVFDEYDQQREQDQQMQDYLTSRTDEPPCRCQNDRHGEGHTLPCERLRATALRLRLILAAPCPWRDAGE